MALFFGMYHLEYIYPFVIGFVLDAFFGDPRLIPHPVVLFGKLISFFDKKFNLGSNIKVKGGVVAVSLILISFFLFWVPLKVLWLFATPAYYFFSAFFVFQGLANHCLIKETFRVCTELSKNGLEAGRKRLSYIVGRDTSELNAQQIRTACLETLSENLSDGVIAPMFYYAIGGVPLMFAYKMINTLDSMIGYKTERYKQFGFFAAKIDDLFNYVPARITAILMVLVSVSFRGFLFIFKYGNKHSSPNAGYPESALAGILNCRFGGPNMYFGTLVVKPYIGTNEKLIEMKDLRKAIAVNMASSIVFLCVVVSCLLFVDYKILLGV